MPLLHSCKNWFMPERVAAVVCRSPKHTHTALHRLRHTHGEAGIMTDAADDFDALFEEVSAQRASTQAEPVPAPVAAAPAPAANGEDDLEALFDQVSSGQSAAA